MNRTWKLLSTQQLYIPLLLAALTLAWQIFVGRVTWNSFTHHVWRTIPVLVGVGIIGIWVVILAAIDLNKELARRANPRVLIYAPDGTLAPAAKQSQFPAISMGLLFSLFIVVVIYGSCRVIYRASLSDEPPQILPARLDFVRTGQTYTVQIHNPADRVAYSNLFILRIQSSASSLGGKDFKVQISQDDLKELPVESKNRDLLFGDVQSFTGIDARNNPVILLWFYKLDPDETRHLSLQAVENISPEAGGMLQSLDLHQDIHVAVMPSPMSSSEKPVRLDYKYGTIFLPVELKEPITIDGAMACFKRLSDAEVACDSWRKMVSPGHLQNGMYFIGLKSWKGLPEGTELQ